MTYRFKVRVDMLSYERYQIVYDDQIAVADALDKSIHKPEDGKADVIVFTLQP